MYLRPKTTYSQIFVSYYSSFLLGISVYFEFYILSQWCLKSEGLISQGLGVHSENLLGLEFNLK